MSMIGNLRRLSDADLQRLLQSPDLIDRYLYEDAVDGFGPFADQDVDKAWHGIHFLLNGSPWDGDPVLGFLVRGGEEVGDIDVGYGPARGFNAADVTAIAEQLQALTPDALRRRFDPAAMTRADVYPAIWDRASARDENLDYLMSNYDALRGFVAEASQAGEALLLYLS